ncbi:MAG: hypothetical protein E5V28_04125 [Mesorhizobium sp.]|nr:MAG: hypothetical protein E5V28_04125 [Mesorhizobium sp.]
MDEAVLDATGNHGGGAAAFALPMSGLRPDSGEAAAHAKSETVESSGGFTPGNFYCVWVANEPTKWICSIVAPLNQDLLHVRVKNRAARPGLAPGNMHQLPTGLAVLGPIRSSGV